MRLWVVRDGHVCLLDKFSDPTGLKICLNTIMHCFPSPPLLRGRIIFSTLPRRSSVLKKRESGSVVQRSSKTSCHCTGKTVITERLK